MEGPSSSEPDSKVEAESAEDDEAGLAPPAPPPSQATTPERAPAEIEIETPPPPGQSVEHRRHRRNRSLTFDPVAAEKGVLKPPPTPDSASSADESEKCSKSAPFEAETPSKPTQASTACPPEDVPSSAPVSTSAAAAANRTLGLPQMPSLLDGQEHGTASVGTRIPGQILLVENEASCAPCEGHAPVADDVARTAQLPAVGRSPQAPGSSTSLRPDETHVLLKSDSIRHHSADAYVDPDPGGQLLEQGLVLAKPPTVQGLQATRPAIMVTEASHVNECPQQLQPGKQWDFLDKELFGSRMPTPEPPGA